MRRDTGRAERRLDDAAGQRPKRRLTRAICCISQRPCGRCQVPGRQLAGVRVAVLRWDSRRRVRPHSGERGQPAPRMWGRARLLFTRKTLQLDRIGCGLSRIPAGTPARVARANGLLEATATYLVAAISAEKPAPLAHSPMYFFYRNYWFQTKNALSDFLGAQGSGTALPGHKSIGAVGGGCLVVHFSAMPSSERPGIAASLAI